MPEKGPVCLITGLGDGTGGACARRFAAGGYRIAMLARTKERLDRFEVELEGYFEKTVPESKDSKQPGRRPSRPFADRFSDADSA